MSRVPLLVGRSCHQLFSYGRSNDIAGKTFKQCFVGDMNGSNLNYRLSQRMSFKFFTLSNVNSTLNLQLRSSYDCQKRFLNLHEYQSLHLMRSFNVTTPQFARASTEREALNCAQAMGQDMDYVVKAQVLTGGRGLGYFKENGFQGGVHVCTSPEYVRDVSSQMLEKTLVTQQTGPTGKPCHMVMVAERFYIRQERYFAILMDRETGGPMLIGSSIGGTSIEKIAESHPESIIKYPVNIEIGLTESEATAFAQRLGFDNKKLDQATKSILGLYHMFISKDCTLVEVNPFAETHDGRVIVCDAKINFDDNAEYRQREIFSMRDLRQEDSREVNANRFDLNYVGLDGDIGCMVNGAGLAMATLDIIKLKGGNPANFLDVGGGADKKQVVEAFRILQTDPQVKVLLVNIFGGIMRCDVIALGIIHASQEVGLTKPLVVRLEGTNQDRARELLDNSGLRMMFTSNLESAAKKSVKMVEILNLANTAELDVSFAM